jgi:hypothetical protein
MKKTKMPMARKKKDDMTKKKDEREKKKEIIRCDTLDI